MSMESLDTAGGRQPLLVPLLSVATRPPPLKKKQCRSDGAEESGETDVYRESETFRRESLIATLVCFPLGIVSLCFSLEVTRWNNEGQYGRAHAASRRAESTVKCAFRFSVILYVILGLLLLGLIEAAIVVGIDKAHTSNL